MYNYCITLRAEGTFCSVPRAVSRARGAMATSSARILAARSADDDAPPPPPARWLDDEECRNGGAPLVIALYVILAYLACEVRKLYPPRRFNSRSRPLSTDRRTTIISHGIALPRRSSVSRAPARRLERLGRRRARRDPGVGARRRRDAPSARPRRAVARALLGPGGDSAETGRRRAGRDVVPRCVQNKSFSPIVQFQHLIASPFNCMTGELFLYGMAPPREATSDRGRAVGRGRDRGGRARREGVRRVGATAASGTRARERGIARGRGRGRGTVWRVLEPRRERRAARVRPRRGLLEAIQQSARRATLENARAETVTRPRRHGSDDASRRDRRDRIRRTMRHRAVLRHVSHLVRHPTNYPYDASGTTRARAPSRPSPGLGLRVGSPARRVGRSTRSTVR